MLASCTVPRRYAALDSSSHASGAGPHTYVEKMGIGSLRVPLDMMMPSGSSGRFGSAFLDIMIASVMRDNKAQRRP